MRRSTDDDDGSDTQRNIRENQEGKALSRISDQVIFPGDIAEVSFYPNGLIKTIKYRTNEQNAATRKKAASLGKTPSQPWGKNFWQLLNERVMEKVKRVNARVNQKLSTLRQSPSQPWGKNFWQLLNQRAMEKVKRVNARVNQKLSESLQNIKEILNTFNERNIYVN